LRRNKRISRPKKKKQAHSAASIPARSWRAAAGEVLSAATMGIAHDLNNCLTGVFSIADLCLHETTRDHPLRERIEMIQRNGQAAVVLVQRLFREHSAAIGRQEYHDLNQLVLTNFELVRWAVPKSIELRNVFSSEALPVFFDAIEFRTVCLHLALNAAAAIPGRGFIEFETGLAAPSKSKGRGKRGMAFLEVTDSGNGFDSRKPLRDGLGLRLVRDFAQRCKGELQIEENEPQGSIVKLLIPRAEL
jgi:signal transduction histidine kinase